MKSFKQSPCSETPPVLVLTQEVLRTIVETIGMRPAESGGPIGGRAGENRVTHFHFDNDAKTSAATYSPNHEGLTRLLQETWNPGGTRLLGFVHSHPKSFDRPSGGDLVYAEKFFAAIPDLEKFWLPIVTTISDAGSFSLTPYVVVRGKRSAEVIRGVVTIVGSAGELECMVETTEGRCAVTLDQEVDKLVLQPRPATVGATKATATNANGAAPVSVGPVPAIAPGDETFDRVNEAYDLGLMGNSRIVCVGAGGASGWLEDLARAGLGQFVLVDHDIVSETNLATQQTYRRDIGRKKVDCIAERIRDINPKAEVIALAESLDDLSDADVARLARFPINGRSADQTLLCGMTDAFLAQARMNRLALHLGLPSLAAQVYREGRAAEITFTHPKVTPACHRCALGGRYRHILNSPPTARLTSHGTPIFATTRLNALKGFIALALLHHGSAHRRWGGLLTRIGKRNLVQIRMDPDLAEVLGLKVFDQVFAGADRDRLAFDEVVWLPQEPEGPATGFEACPDCGGTGNLLSCIGTFEDTRSMPTAHRAIRVA
jgi:proteasome lid subunit RPN8/RPN11